jgi:hypothetical protein
MTMKRVGVLCAATLGAVTAHAAGCGDIGSAASTQAQIAMPAPADTSAFAGRPADKNIVGTWLVSYFTAGGDPAGQAFIQWHSDGTEWENINFAPGAVCMGSWKKVDVDHVSRNHFGWTFANGVRTGYFNETEITRVGQDGRYHGLTHSLRYDLDGNLVSESHGSSRAVYITP